MTIDKLSMRTGTVRCVSTSITKGDKVSWPDHGRRLFGHVVTVRGDYCMTESDDGTRHAVRPRDLTKEHA